MLLAANPRPATIPAQYAWRQAEAVSHERNLAVPSNGSLSQLARTNTILIEDASLLIDDGDSKKLLQTISKDEGEELAVCYAASLMEHCSSLERKRYGNMQPAPAERFDRPFMLQRKKTVYQVKLTNCRYMPEVPPIFSGKAFRF